MAETLKKKVKPGRIELHPSDPLIVVHYETVVVDLAQAGEDGQPRVVASKPGQKKIKLSSFAADSPADAFAEQVLASCKYIHSSKLGFVTGLLEDLRTRIVRAAGGGEKQQQQQQQQQWRQPAVDLEAERARIEAEVRAKIEREREHEAAEAAARAAQAAAQSRVDDNDGDEEEEEEEEDDDDDEDAGGIDNDQGRRAEREEAPRRSKRRPKSAKPKAKKKKRAVSLRKVDAYAEELYEEDPERKVEGALCLLELAKDPENLTALLERQHILQALSRLLSEERASGSTRLLTPIAEFFFCFSNFSQLHGVLLGSKIGAASMQLLDAEAKRYAGWRARLADGSLGDKAYRKLVRAQEKLVYASLYTLLNLAEEVSVEVKMARRDIVGLLCGLLERCSGEAERGSFRQLQVLVLSFLKKLSIYRENASAMLAAGVVPRLAAALERRSPDVRAAALRLAYNLTFEQDARPRLVGLVDSVVACLREPGTEQQAARVLYALSADPRLAAAASGALARAAPAVAGLACGGQPSREMAALAVNMAARESNAAAMAPLLPAMVRQALATLDPLAAKLVRNVSDHAGSGAPLVLSRHLHELAGIARKAQSDDVRVEALCALANAAVPDCLYADLLQHHQLLDLLVRVLHPGYAEDDLVLAAVMAVGTLATDPRSSPVLANGRLLRLLADVLREKNSDVEITLQCVYSVFKLLLHSPSREAVIENERLVSSLLELVADECAQIRRFSHLCLDIVADCADDELRDRILERRFEAYNSEWIRFVSDGAYNPDDDGQHQLASYGDVYDDEDEDEDEHGYDHHMYGAYELEDEDEDL